MNETVEKPWGYEYLMYQNEEMAIWLLHIDAGKETSLHCHNLKTTTMVVLDGQVEIHGLNSNFNLKELEILEIENGTFHKNFSKHGAYLFEIEKPNLKLDLYRLSDKNGRFDSNYENQSHYKKIKNNFNYIFFENDSDLKKDIFKQIGESKILVLEYQNYLKNKINFNNNIHVLLESKYNKHLIGEILNFSQLQNLDETDKILFITTNTLNVNGSDQLCNLIALDDSTFFSSIGTNNLHLIESIARKEKINLNIFPSDEIAFKAMVAYNKLSKIKGIFIPGSTNGFLKSFIVAVSSWIDSVFIKMIIVTENEFHRNNTLRQNEIKGVPFASILSIISAKIKIVKNFGFLERMSLFSFTWDSKKNKRSRPEVLFISLQTCTKKVKEKKLISKKFQYLLTFLPKNWYKLKLKIERIKFKLFYLVLLIHIIKYKQLSILLGDGVDKFDINYQNFLEICEKFKIPIFTSRSGVQLISNDSTCFRDRVGGYGSRVGNHILLNSKVILSVGCRMSTSFTTRNNVDFAKKVKVFYVDIDNSEHGHAAKKSFFKLKMDSSNFLNFVLPKLNTILSKVDNSWIIKTMNIYLKYSNFESFKDESNLSIYGVLNKITKSFQSNSLIVVDGGTLLHYSNQSSVVKRDQSWLTLSSLEESEFAIPASLGVYVFESRKLIKKPIHVICYKEDLLRCADALHFIDDNNLPISIHAIQRNYIQNGSEIKKIIYPYSVVLNDSQRIDENDNFVNNFKNIKVVYNASLKKINRREDSPIITIYTVDNFYEMDPRPGFEVSSNGVWKANSLLHMEPISKVDELIKKDMEI